MAKTKSSTHGKQQKKIVTVSGYKKAGGVKVNREIKLLVGTDAASEGLNLQTLSTLINLDLPWNPTRLEQRKGRIQRIGQISDKIHIYNMKKIMG